MTLSLLFAVIKFELPDFCLLLLALLLLFGDASMLVVALLKLPPDLLRLRRARLEEVIVGVVADRLLAFLLVFDDEDLDFEEEDEVEGAGMRLDVAVDEVEPPQVTGTKFRDLVSIESNKSSSSSSPPLNTPGGGSDDGLWWFWLDMSEVSN